MDATFTSGTPVCGIVIQTEMDLFYENNELFSVNLSVNASANPKVGLGTNILIRIRDEQSKSEKTHLYPLPLLLQVQ